MLDRRRLKLLFCFLAGSAAGTSACDRALDPPATHPPIKEQPTPTDPPTGPCTTPACTPLDPVLPYTGNHPLDAAIHESMVRAGINFEPAGELELCRRLSADLLGKLPTREEFQQDCAGRTPEAIVRDFQSRDRYLLNSQRAWQDRFRTNDVFSDWRYQKSLYALVDAAQTGAMKYGDFAIEVLAHPGLVLMDFVPDDMARRAFRSFLGREATDAEAADLSAMFRPWIPAQIADEDFPEIYTFSAYLLPELCEPISRCATSLFGGAKVNIPSSPFITYVPYGRLSMLQADALKEVGRLFVRQPIFWEAEADVLLSRFLGWSDGGRTPREPGVLLPELREALANYLKQTGDLPGAERLVLTSELYLQKTNIEPDGYGNDPAAPQKSVFAYGPLKAAQAETWLDTIAPLTYIDLGTCDPRYPDYYTYLLLYDAFDQGAITSTAALEEKFVRLHELQESRIAMSPGYYGIAEPNTYYTYYARQLGGCPGFGVPRGAPAGLAFGFAQETFAELACDSANNALPPGTDISTAQIVDHQMSLLYARNASDEEQSMIENALHTCRGEDCTQAGIVRSVCTMLTGSSEMLFY